MADSAQRWNSLTEQWEPIEASELEESMRNDRFRCDACFAEAGAAIGEVKKYFFSALHAPNCPKAKGKKLLRLNSRTEIDFGGIFRFIDRDRAPGGGREPRGGVHGGGMDDADDEPEVDYRLDPNATRTIRSVRGVYNEFRSRRGDDCVDDFSNRVVNSIFLRRENLKQMREDWGFPMKLVVARRCAPKVLKPPILAPEGYAVLRDAYSEDDAEAFYFLVKMRHPGEDAKFKDKLYGRTEIVGEGVAAKEIKGVGRDPHKHIVMIAEWERVPDENYTIFKADLNSRMVAFINAADA